MAEAEKGVHLNIKVRSNTGEEVYFKIKKNTALKKLMDAYCTRENLVPNSVRFLFDGNRLKPTDTPDQLDMEDGDMIDVQIEQSGGC
ncbi:MAG: putative SUMO1b protein [Streblomastix strix]|uniref:Putative SUMO1b protein n=1 Tax=Streblomastix strix TaxID=222440 RepID=A0A5J4X913_9EUKA|nr:MAG: putative SUMO1b protein [Streblomastix strix]